MLIKKFFLQLFAEGGGDGGDAGTGESNSGEEMPIGIPDRAKKNYQKALEKTKGYRAEDSSVSTPQQKEDTYEDLIKSDKYKDAHKAYMDKTIGDRLKKYKGMEADYGKARTMLEAVAQKYGVDSSSASFLDDLNAKIEADDSYYEDYALEHDISTEDARKMVTMERKLKAIEQQKAEEEAQENARQQILHLQRNAEQTKLRFPQFDLETEMQDERFRRICAVTNGDTTAAYMNCHWQDIMFNTAQNVAQNAKVATANAISSGSRPIEQGANPSTPSVNQTDFSKMNLDELRAYARSQRMKK